MERTKFTRRFRELVADLSDKELGLIMGVSAIAARKMRNGDIKSLKLQAALRLAKELKISPWYLGGEPEPVTSARTEALAKSAGREVAKSSTSRKAAPRESLEGGILRDEVTALGARVSRLEAALKNLQSNARASPAHRI